MDENNKKQSIDKSLVIVIIVIATLLLVILAYVKFISKPENSNNDEANNKTGSESVYNDIKNWFDKRNEPGNTADDNDYYAPSDYVPFKSKYEVNNKEITIPYDMHGVKIGIDTDINNYLILNPRGIVGQYLINVIADGCSVSISNQETYNFIDGLTEDSYFRYNKELEFYSASYKNENDIGLFADIYDFEDTDFGERPKIKFIFKNLDNYNIDYIVTAEIGIVDNKYEIVKAYNDTALEHLYEAADSGDDRKIVEDMYDTRFRNIIVSLMDKYNSLQYLKFENDKNIVVTNTKRFFNVRATAADGYSEVNNADVFRMSGGEEFFAITLNYDTGSSESYIEPIDDTEEEFDHIGELINLDELGIDDDGRSLEDIIGTVDETEPKERVESTTKLSYDFIKNSIWLRINYVKDSDNYKYADYNTKKELLYATLAKLLDEKYIKSYEYDDGGNIVFTHITDELDYISIEN